MTSLLGKQPFRSKGSDYLWSAVASVARHRFGYSSGKRIQSAVAASLCRRTPKIKCCESALFPPLLHGCNCWSAACQEEADYKHRPNAERSCCRATDP